MIRYLPVLLFLLVVAVACGCSDSSKATVSGQVTLDGAPLKEGTIDFYPVDGKSTTASGTISQGNYSAQVPVGEHQVKIRAPKVIGKRKMIPEPDAKEVDDVVELLPDKYNDKTELKLSVKAGSQTKDWPLESK